MEDLIHKTKLLAEANALNFKDIGNGHVQISGHGVLINYWPDSKKQTVHIAGGDVLSHCKPWDAVRLCLTEEPIKKGKGKSKNPKRKSKKHIKPKHVSVNEPAVQLGGIKRNPAGVSNFYTGKRPPWEFEEFIICQSDQLRIDAWGVICEADRMDYEEHITMA